MKTEGSNVVITGGEGDLASELAAHLSHQGFDVNAPGRAQLDVSCRASVEDYFAQHETDLLICSAGITRDKSLGLLTEKDWDVVLDVNLKGAIRCVKAAVESMGARGGGSIVLVSSYSALHPPKGQAAYAAAKAALLGYVSELSQEHGKDNIRANAILPGFMNTKMTASVSKQRMQQVLAQHDLGRFNTCAAVAAFIGLLHRQLIHTSGQVFQLDSRSLH
jgi:3-oxoacyl-[acyl-carrier protein] reductase